MFGFTIIRKQKLRRLALDYQTKCLEVKRLKEELKEMGAMFEGHEQLRSVPGEFTKAGQ